MNLVDIHIILVVNRFLDDIWFNV